MMHDAADALLRVQNLEMVFGGITAVADLDFSINTGEIVALIGPNGAGKTTCFNMVTGFYKPTRGAVYFQQKEITGKRPYEIARLGLVRSFQKTNVMKKLTVFENVLTGHYLSAPSAILSTFLPGKAVRDAENAARENAAKIVETIGLKARMDASAHLLSCGELRLLEVAVALAAKPALLMLDEPAAGLNSHEALEFGQILKTLIGQHIDALLIVEHNMSLVMDVSDRIVVMNFGRKIAEGMPEEVMSHEEVVDAYLGKAAGL